MRRSSIIYYHERWHILHESLPLFSLFIATSSCILITCLPISMRVKIWVSYFLSTIIILSRHLNSDFRSILAFQCVAWILNRSSYWQLLCLFTIEHNMDIWSTSIFRENNFYNQSLSITVSEKATIFFTRIMAKKSGDDWTFFLGVCKYIMSCS